MLRSLPWYPLIGWVCGTLYPKHPLSDRVGLCALVVSVILSGLIVRSSLEVAPLGLVWSSSLPGYWTQMDISCPCATDSLRTCGSRFHIASNGHIASRFCFHLCLVFFSILPFYFALRIGMLRRASWDMCAFRQLWTLVPDWGPSYFLIPGLMRPEYSGIAVCDADRDLGVLAETERAPLSSSASPLFPYRGSCSQAFLYCLASTLPTSARLAQDHRGLAKGPVPCDPSVARWESEVWLLERYRRRASHAPLPLL